MPDQADTPEYAAPTQDVEPRVVVRDEVVTVSVRRAPKYTVFVVLGAGLGILVALILTFTFNGSNQESANTGMVYSPTQVFGFLALVCGVVGVVVGGVVALIFDRVLSRRSREVAADRESAHFDD
ncbi:potassium transporter Trk [Microbacterium sp. P01]|uniref:potassium transporter Trk n=1 Tax=unclassified Microbacterium TaxID=2609290 RepID=UPI00366BA421